jgi:hypothetical protein
MAEDEAFQEQYGTPGPDAVSTADPAAEDHSAVQDRWADPSEWRTTRRGIRLLRRAIERAGNRSDSGVCA